MNDNKSLYLVEVDDEDLKVSEKWLVKVSLIEEEVDEEMVSKKMVLEIIEKIAGDGTFESLELGYEMSKLPVITLTSWQKRMLMSGDNEKITIEKRCRRKE